MRYLSMVCVFGLFGVAILMGSTFASFIDMASLFVVFVGGVFVTLSFHTPREVKEALAAGLSNAPVAPESVRIHRGVLGTIRTAIIGSGVLGTLIGLVQMLANLDDPTQLGPAMAVALLTLLYSVFLSELWLAPMSNRLLVRGETAPDRAGEGPVGPSGLLNVTGVFSFMVSFGLLLFALNP